MAYVVSLVNLNQLQNLAGYNLLNTLKPNSKGVTTITQKDIDNA